MSQLTLVWSAPFDPEREPDNRHPWGKFLAWGGRQTEWRCNVCGEQATVSACTGRWLFFRPQLAKPPRGPWHYDRQSHVCEPREWQ